MAKRRGKATKRSAPRRPESPGQGPSERGRGVDLAAVDLNVGDLDPGDDPGGVGADWLQELAPQDVEAFLATVDVPPAIADRLRQGLSPTGEMSDLLVFLAATTMAEVAACRRPLDAELALCESLAALEHAAPDDADDDEIASVRAETLRAMVDHAVETGTPEALALLRVLAGFGSDEQRRRARTEADRLAAAGVPDRTWGRLVGRPRFVRAWRYGDVFDEQESITLHFVYARRDHAITTLVDHVLGGGVKDCWVADGPDARDLRDTLVAEIFGDRDLVLEDLGADEAAALLAAALEEPACPEDEEQVEGVVEYRELLRSRLRWLGALGPGQD